MFARIAGRYDLLNRLLSFGIDRRWRDQLLGLAGDVQGSRVVDVCCGTGDVARLFARRGARVVGVDFTAEMLRIAGRKRPPPGALPPLYLRGDALRLPVRATAADLVTVAFGIRNLSDRGAFLAEAARVLRPGGRLLVLEFGSPSGKSLAAVHRVYMSRILPRVGAAVSGDREAYSYLPASVAAWPGAAELLREFERAGYADCGQRPLSGGIARLHWGTARA